MLFKEKYSKERVQHLALGMVASSISQWKLSLGEESVFIPTTTTMLPQQIRDHSTHVFNPQTFNQGLENHSVVALILDQRSGGDLLPVVQFTGALNRSAEQSRILGC